MMEPKDAAQIYLSFMEKRTAARKAGSLIAVTLPFSYPDGEALEVYIRYTSSGVTVTDYGRTISFLTQYGALDARPRHVARVIAELCGRYEAQFTDGEVRVDASEPQIGEALCCITEAIQAVAGMIVLADVLHTGGGGGSRVVTRLKTRLNEAGLATIHQKDPLHVEGKSKVHDIRFAYPDHSTFILTQSLKSEADDKARQVAFDSVDILQGYHERGVLEPHLICVYQAPTDEKNLSKLPDVLRMLENWFVHVYEVDDDASRLVKRITRELTEIGLLPPAANN